MKTLLIVLGLAQASPAAVIYSGIQDIPIPVTFDGVFVDVVNVTSSTVDDSDFSSSQINFFFGGAGVYTSPRLRPVRSIPDQLAPIVSAQLGDVIDESLAFGPVARGGSENHIGSGGAQFPNGGESYLGFLLDLNEDGQYVAGWMRVTLSETGSVGTVHDWAYSDLPGEPVITGTIIPESSSMFLLSLALSSLCLSRRRA
jgi:hypothetical protein